MLCTFQTDHLSLFTVGTPDPSIISQIVSFFGGGGGVVKDNCLYNAKKSNNLP
jgi:hypothetical protein